MTPSVTPTRCLLAGTTLLALVACGGGERPSGDAAPTTAAADAARKPMVREPLTEADLAGLSMTNLSVELPWTTNLLSRDPAPAAPKASLKAADMSETDGFDRVIFTFGADAPFPGYRIQMADSSTSVPCGQGSKPIEVEDGTRAMVIRLSPAQASDRGQEWVPVRMRNVKQTRFASAGVVCDNGGSVVWVAHVSRGEDVRVLEMRSPNRLVVDIR